MSFIDYQLVEEIKNGYPVTHYAQNLPVVQNNIVAWNNCFDGNVRMSTGHNCQHSHIDCIDFAQRFLEWFLSRPQDSVFVYSNTLTVSYALPGFKVGKTAQDFLPKRKGMPKHAIFTYQMLSRNVQATYYTEHGQRFLAGICYYLQPRGSNNITIKYDERVMWEALHQSQPFRNGSRYATVWFASHRFYGRFCGMAGKQVAVWRSRNCDSEPVHANFNYDRLQYETERCDECYEESMNYKYPLPMPQQQTDSFQEPEDDYYQSSDDYDYDYESDECGWLGEQFQQVRF